MTASANVNATVNAVDQAHTGPSATTFGHHSAPESGTTNGTAADFTVSWAGLAAAVEELYT
jgi:hypothetical protein